MTAPWTDPETGQIGYPDVAVYEMLEGPNRGEFVIVPPRFDSHPHPDSGMPTRMMDVKRAHIDISVAYRLKILDRPAYDEIAATGFWTSREHLGPGGMSVDQRKAPGS